MRDSKGYRAFTQKVREKERKKKEKKKEKEKEKEKKKKKEKEKKKKKKKEKEKKEKKKKEKEEGKKKATGISCSPPGVEHRSPTGPAPSAARSSSGAGEAPSAAAAAHHETHQNWAGWPDVADNLARFLFSIDGTANDTHYHGEGSTVSVPAIDHLLSRVKASFVQLTAASTPQADTPAFADRASGPHGQEVLPAGLLLVVVMRNRVLTNPFASFSRRKRRRRGAPRQSTSIPTRPVPQGRRMTPRSLPPLAAAGREAWTNSIVHSPQPLPPATTTMETKRKWRRRGAPRQSRRLLTAPPGAS